MNLIHVLVLLSVTLTTVIESRLYQLCGNRLDEMLGLVCKDQGFNTRQSSGHISMIQTPLFRQLMGTGGIVSECCYNACSLSTLRSYCASPPETPITAATEAPTTTRAPTQRPTTLRPIIPITHRPESMHRNELITFTLRPILIGVTASRNPVVASTK